MMRFVFLAVFLLFPVLAMAQSSTGTVTMTFDLSAQPAGEAATLWIPYPVSDRTQDITNVQVAGDYATSAVYADKAESNPMLVVQWDKNATSRKVTFRFDVVRDELLRKDIPTKEPDWNPADYSEFLKATSLGPVDGPVREKARAIVKKQKTVAGKAKAIYDWMCENTYRNPDTRGCGAGNVCELLKDPGGKCADLSSLFVALCRAADVPAREVFGLRLSKKDTDDVTTWQHCWAEFFVPGYGWVPADPADVRKLMLVEKLDLDDPKVKTARDYFWGCVDAYRVSLSHGRDLTLNPAQYGDAVNYLMYPYAQVGDKTLDWLDPKTFVYSISYAKK